MTRTAAPRPAKRWALVLLLLAAAVAAALLLARRRAAPPGESAAFEVATGPEAKNDPRAHVEGLPRLDKPVELDALDESPVPTVRLKVYEPAKARAALRANPWLAQVAKQPLGVGFAGDWGAFLGTKGSDLHDAFTGTVLDVVLDKLLGAPFDLVWFGGKRGVSTPALVMRDGGSAADAYQLLERVAARGVYTVPGCLAAPDDAPAQPAKGAPLRIVCWTLAEHAVFAARASGRIVLAMHPTAALQGLCTELADVSRPSGTDLEVLFAPDALGREYQGLAALLGGAKTPRLQFAIEDDQLKPRGLGAALAAPGRLDAGALADDLLKLVPEQTGVVLTAQLRLPAKLDAASLKAHFAAAGGKPAADARTRQVALLWQPRGDDAMPTETALIWSSADDEPALRELFAGANHPRVGLVCGKAVVASGDAVLRRVRDACAGTTPSMVHAAPPVRAGLQARASIILGVNFGRLGSQLIEDGWRSSPDAKKAPNAKGLPESIETARKQLIELPYFGLTGTVDDGALVPGGFRS